MTTIEVKINDDLLKIASTQYIKDYIQEQLDFLKLKALAQEINQAISESGINFDSEMGKAKHKAWEEYKAKYLTDIIND